MSEIRSIREEEAEEFLALLCAVFHLDKSRAEAIFYKEPFFDLNRKWALFSDGKMISILTTTPMKFGWGDAIGIAGVATLPDYRKKGYGVELLSHVLADAESKGETGAMLFAHEANLYQKVGFEHGDNVVKGHVKTEPGANPQVLEHKDVQVIYDTWASKNTARLIRTERRWKFWGWIFRHCLQVGNGYLCHEHTLCREAILDETRETWPLLPNSEWYGLESMTNQLSVPLHERRQELLLMCRNIPEMPQMFMTDQF